MDENIREFVKNSLWNTVHASHERKNIVYDDWLDLFEKEIEKCTTPIIDLGCGAGNDTLYLIEKSKEVIPCDYSEKAIENILKNFPKIKRAELFDMTKGLPFPDDFTNIIIADLSLHYFSQKVTFYILEEIKRVLKSNGILLFRVNSIKDIKHAEEVETELEKHFYHTPKTGYKRYFNEEDIKYFFEGWGIIHMKEETMIRYPIPKKLWCCAVKPSKN